jgi:hypothetical protein
VSGSARSRSRLIRVRPEVQLLPGPFPGLPVSRFPGHPSPSSPSSYIVRLRLSYTAVTSCRRTRRTTIVCLRRSISIVVPSSHSRVDAKQGVVWCRGRGDRRGQGDAVKPAPWSADNELAVTDLRLRSVDISHLSVDIRLLSGDNGRMSIDNRRMSVATDECPWTTDECPSTTDECPSTTDECPRTSP